MRHFIVTAAAAALTASLSLGALPALAHTDAHDLNGTTDLGVNISAAGTTSASVRQFLAQLGPEARRGVLGGCETALSNQSAVAPTVVPFCQLAVES